MPKARGQRQAYHLTCSNCRSKKMKCDGAWPRCGICEVYGSPCKYDKAPPMTQIVAMADKIKKLEKTLEELGGAQTSSTSEAANINDTQEPLSHIEIESSVYLSNDDVHGHNASPGSSNDPEAYYSSTSAVQEPGITEVLHSTILSNRDLPAEQRLLTHTTLTPQQLQFWEESAINAASIHLQLPQAKVSHLLKTHWTWVHPSFLFVPRQEFLRDCSIGGPSFSPALLSVICLHSTRFTDHDLSDELLARSRLLIGQDIHKESTMPTIQALLQFSAREIGKGSVSTAWLYSGIAFRMAIDMGVFTKRKSNVEPQTEFLRRRLAWSCYLWDKAISLYLGRVPTLTDPPEMETGADRVQNDDEHLWRPSPEAHEPNLRPYSPTPALIDSCFSNFCKLSVIVSDILLNVYGKNRPNDPSEFLKRARNNLQQWHLSSPDHFKIPRTAEISPPPHILSQRLLYHTSLILLHRPFWKNEQCEKICREASAEVEFLLLLLEKSLGFSRVPYLMAYCTYTAATVAVEDMKKNIPGSQVRVNTYLRALYGSRASCPGIQRSIDIIMKGFNANTTSLSSSHSAPNQSPPVADPIRNSQHLLPAFPFPEWDYTLPGNSFFGMPSTSPEYSILDAFPQQWTEYDENLFDQMDFLAPAL